METELALALSARDWSDRLHRFLADHGGARVRLTATGPEDLLAEEFDVLLIDDICSFMTPRLIEQVKVIGRGVIGVYDPDEFADGKERLLECGVDEVIECDAHPDEFLRAISRAGFEVHSRAVHAGTAKTLSHPVSLGRSSAVAVGGPPGGTGATEVAITVAQGLASLGEPVILVDCDDSAPAVAQRLGLVLHPNLRTALDVLEHRSGIMDSAMQGRRDLGFRVIAGLPNPSDWRELRPRRLLDLVTELAENYRLVINVGSYFEPVGVADGSERHGVTRSMIGFADRMIAVGMATPVGMARLLEWIARAQPLRPPDSRRMDVVINRAPVDQYRRADLVDELVRSYRPASLVMLPEDKAVTRAAWDGLVVEQGKWAKELHKWIDTFCRTSA